MNKLIIICGFSFSGKTTLGKAIAKRFGYEEVDVDAIKDKLYGKGINDEDLNREQWSRLYDETDKQIEDLLKIGKTVIDSSRNFKKDERKLAKKIADKAKIKLVTIFVDTQEDIVRKRWQDNRKNQTRHDISDNGFVDILQKMEKPTPDENFLTFRYGDDIENWISKNLEVLS